MNLFEGYHSEWNLGSPGGWDYQKTTQIIGKAVWQKLCRITKLKVDLDFDHPLFFPVDSFADMLIAAHAEREGSNPGLIAVVAEAETLEDVTENRNLAERLSTADGITGALMAPQELELENGRVCWQGQPVSIIFMDFNTDVLLALHRKHDLTPVLQAVKEHRVINPRGTEPFNVKSMFELISGRHAKRFHKETVARTPWTRQFYARKTEAPDGSPVDDLIAWTRRNWDALVLKPERGYSGHGVRVGTVNSDIDEAIELALSEGNYIVQEKIPLQLWAEDIPYLENDTIGLERVQTDFRCLVGPEGLLGFVGRFGGVPTNVGSGGGFQPLALLRSPTNVRDAVDHMNDVILSMDSLDLQHIIEDRNAMATQMAFTYLLGPVRVALRPRLITREQLQALAAYGNKVWADCLRLEKMWLAGELDRLVRIEQEELDIARLQPWKGSAAIIASDGLFNFGAAPISEDRGQKTEDRRQK
ncbi:MAG: hypothetical protein JRF36_14020 [Deltaproteobacteria bacterium]|nr:hypothetical protein [Deltaproteobacteria bacterium]